MRPDTPFSLSEVRPGVAVASLVPSGRALKSPTASGLGGGISSDQVTAAALN